MTRADFNSLLVRVNVAAVYLPSHSSPTQSQYTFAYTITVTNGASLPVQLLSRHWIITDADEQIQEVRGEGVVGEQPVIQPQAAFRYTSGATLNTPIGYMEGSYSMVVRENMEIDPAGLPTFEVPVPAFSLHTPTALN
ncbi:MAG: Co2+/Mg2+ efflux protein ApaG [Halioglobus sp.]|nr:Co2+/Mg2+ efflux protein ApaG [Halioglobus sp.]